MGLLSFGRHRIGFWMAERTGVPEVPDGTVLREHGTRVPGGASLVLVGADESGVPVWSFLLHAPEGASLLLPWEDRLFAAVGSRAVLLDEHGVAHATLALDDELLFATRAGEALLLFGRIAARLIDRDARVQWTAPLAGDGFQPLSLEGERFRIAVRHGDDWDDVVLDARTGAILAQR